MARNSPINLDVRSNADGFQLSGGTTPRTLSLTGGDVTMTGSGSFTYTYPGASTTLVGTDVAQTLSKKTWAANTTSDPSFLITASSAVNVSSPTDGMVWYNGTNLNFRHGSTTRDLTRPRRQILVTFCSGYTPSGTGADTIVFRVPESPADGTTSLAYNVRRLQIRVETADAGTSSVQVERSTGSGSFSASNMMSSALSISGGGTYEANTQTFSTTSVNSGDKMRLNFTAVAGHEDFTVTLLLEEA